MTLDEKLAEAGFNTIAERLLCNAPLDGMMRLDMDLEIAIINSLRPNFKEVCDNKMFQHWVDYEMELDEIDYHLRGGELVSYVNKRLLKLRSGSSEHDAVVDVASTLEESQSSVYKGVFKYE